MTWITVLKAHRVKAHQKIVNTVMALKTILRQLFENDIEAT